MTRKILSGVLAIAGIAAIGFVPTSCQSGGIGDPCTPEDEYTPSFSGFKVTEDNIESRSFQCQSRICLVNHFQGRVSCPLGQPPPTVCTSDADCGGNGSCTPAGAFAPFCAIKCTVDADCNAGAKCTGGKCSDNGGCSSGFTCQDTGHYCGCDQNTKCPTGFACAAPEVPGELGQCKQSVCHKQGDCQVPDNGAMAAKDNAGKACCVPGGGPSGDIPVATAVCGQCSNPRNADNAVYCSCKCGEPFGPDGKTELPRNPNFNYCSCPDGFECKEVRKNIGISDPLLAGQYCIKTKTEFSTSMPCGSVKGHVGAGTGGDVACAGTPSL